MCSLVDACDDAVWRSGCIEVVGPRPQVYNEQIRDLLIPDSPVLDLREDPVKGITVPGLTCLCACSVKEVSIMASHIPSPVLGLVLWKPPPWCSWCAAVCW